MTQTKSPIDEARTARPRVGMVMNDAKELPGVALMGLAMAALVGCLVSAAMGGFGWAIGFAVVAVVVGVAGIVWFSAEHRRATRMTAGRHRATNHR